MSLDKAILHGKEKRKPYRGAKAFDATCRNHGACPWCRDNRLFNRRRKESAAEEKVREWKEGLWNDGLWS